MGTTSKFICIKDCYPIGFIKEGNTFKISYGSVIDDYFLYVDQPHLKDIIEIDGFNYLIEDFVNLRDWKIDRLFSDN